MKSENSGEPRKKSVFSSDNQNSSRTSSPTTRSSNSQSDLKSSQSVKEPKISDTCSPVKRSDIDKVPLQSLPLSKQTKEEGDAKLSQILESVDEKVKSPVPIRLPTKYKSKVILCNICFG